MWVFACGIFLKIKLYSAWSLWKHSINSYEHYYDLQHENEIAKGIM